MGEETENFNLNIELTNNTLDYTIAYEDVTKVDRDTMSIQNLGSRKVCKHNSVHTFADTPILYCSDLHLDYRKLNFNQTISEICSEIYAHNMYQGHIVFCGDISSNFDDVDIFFTELEKIYNSEYARFIYIVGNHELWDRSEKDYKELMKTHKNLVVLCNDLAIPQMHLVKDRCYYLDYKIISYDELTKIDDSELKNIIRQSKYPLIFGGVGYSGQNTKFNASQDCGHIYRDKLTRDQDIAESEKFCKLYEKLLNLLGNKKMIVCTHNPYKDWMNEQNLDERCYYISGHTHIADFNLKDHIFADGQWGYEKYANYILPKLIVSGYEDIFLDYSDGIHTISKEDYINYNRLTGHHISCKRDGEYYLLKKNDIYMFIYYNNNKIYLLSGGVINTLKKTKAENKGRDIHYYFDNMEYMARIYMMGLDSYSMYQKAISDHIINIGGSGRIHGCIVDINFYSHIYVNPYDYSLTPYYAIDMREKYVYKNIPSLLSEHCQYLLREHKSSNIALPELYGDISEECTYYEDTDIYTISKKVKKAQECYNGVLKLWDDEVLKAHMQKITGTENTLFLE